MTPHAYLRKPDRTSTTGEKCYATPKSSGCLRSHSRCSELSVVNTISKLAFSASYTFSNIFNEIATILDMPL